MKRLLVIGLLGSMGFGAAQVSEAEAVEAAWALRAGVAADHCDWAQPAAHAPEVFPLSGEDGGGWLVLLPCRQGFYNLVTETVLVAADASATFAQLPVPELIIDYVDGDSMGAVEHLAIAAINLSAEAVNAWFDPDTATLTAHDKWRGIGDAFTVSRWHYQDGSFSLVHFKVDAVYDGELDAQVLIGGW